MRSGVHICGKNIVVIGRSNTEAMLIAMLLQVSIHYWGMYLPYAPSSCVSYFVHHITHTQHFDCICNAYLLSIISISFSNDSCALWNSIIDVGSGS